MAPLLQRDAVAKIVILGTLWALVNLCSSGDRPATSFSFTISSRRNSTGHRHIKTIFNIPEPLHPTPKKDEDISIDVEQNTFNKENMKIVQFITAFVVKDSRVPPPGYELVPGLGWYHQHTTPLTWEEARLACEAEGAHLAVLNSKEEAAALKKISDKSPAAGAGAYANTALFIGFSDKTEGNYFTIFGETLEEAGYAEWHSGQPNQKLGQTDSDCGAVEKSDYKLNDLPCDIKLAYVCEFSL